MKFESLCVLGLGYIGLPTASTFATHGLKVRGVDVNQGVVDILRDGQVHIQEPGLRTLVQAAFHSNKLAVEAEPAPADAFIIVVPTPITPEKRADLSFVESAAQSIVPHLAEGNLVILESTCPPRTTIDRVAPILEQSGLEAGRDFHLAYSPERVLPGKILHELIENARIVGGITPESAAAGRDLYQLFVRGEIQLTDATTAEMVKLMENTYRDVNIALANEFSHLADRFQVDVWRAIELANLHPRVEILRPGPGVGGHCIGIDPWFLVEAAPESTPLIHQSRLINDNQPAYAVAQVAAAMGGVVAERKIAALGLAYKADVDDLRQSPAIAVVEELVAQGAQVTTYEPVAETAQVAGARAAASAEEAMAQAEAVLLLVDHRELKELSPAVAAEQMTGRLAFDMRGAWPGTAWRQAGFTLKILGVGQKDG